MNFIRRVLFGAALSLGLALATPGAAQATPNDGYFNWSRVGASAVKRFQNGDPQYQDWARSQILVAMGYNAYETSAILQKFNSDECVAGTIKAGDTFKRGSFTDRRGRVRVTGRVRLTDTSEPTFAVCRVYFKAGDQVNGYTFTRDIAVTLVRKCANVVEEEAPPPPPPPPAPPPPPPPAEEVPPPSTPPLPPAPPVVTAKDSLCDRGRVNAVVGAEWEPTINGSNSRSLYGAAGIYCMHDVRDGQVGYGVGGQAAFYGGDVRGVGRFNGHLYGVGPAFMRVWNDGRDLEVKVMAMDYGSSYTQGDYRSRESRQGIGLAVSHNNYRGRIDGSGRPETQIFGQVFLPIGGNTDEYWQGQRIGDGSQLGLAYNVGVRRYLTEGKAWNPYIQAGLLGEVRNGGADYLSGSLRLGVSNRPRTFGCGVGINFNILEGGVHPGVGCWLDVAGMVRRERTMRRAAAIQADLGPVAAINAQE